MTTGSPLMSIIVLNSVVSLVGLTAACIEGTLFSADWRALGWFALTGVVGHGTWSLIFFSAIQRMGVSRGYGDPFVGSSLGRPFRHDLPG